jgi:hypothetical protein
MKRLAFLVVGSIDPTTETLRVGVASPLAIRRETRRFSESRQDSETRHCPSCC